MFGTEQEGLQTNLDFYFRLKKIKEVGESLAKLFNVNDATLSGRISKQVAVLGVESLDKVVNGTSYRVKIGTKVHASVKKDNKDEMIEWMKQHPLGRELVKEDVHPKTLESFVINTLIGNGELPPPFFSIFQAETLDIRKLPK